MKPTIEFHILDYLCFGEQDLLEAVNWHTLPDGLWKRGLAFADTAGLSLHLRHRLIWRRDFGKLPPSIQRAFEQRHSDNVRRTQLMHEECVELNRRLQAADIPYLNLKGSFLAPAFVESPETRVQYDYDFLLKRSDISQAYTLFLRSGYSPLHPAKDVAADHWPTLIQRTGWQWKGNYYDPDIPRAIELHFQLWDSESELIPIQTLDQVWERSCSQVLGSIEAPTLSAQDTLLYAILHSFRHLLRNDLRLAHLYEIAFFLQQTCDQESFWEGVLGEVTQCANTTKMVATTVELAKFLFRPALSAPLSAFVERNLPVTARSWIEVYGRDGAVHCYRKNRNALLLHLSLLESNASRWALLRQRLVPRHLPLPTYGVQIPKERETLKVRVVKAARYVTLVLQRGLFQLRALLALAFQLPAWLIRLKRHRTDPVRSDGTVG